MILAPGRKKITHQGRKRETNPFLKTVSIQTILLIGLVLWVVYLLLQLSKAPTVTPNLSTSLSGNNNGISRPNGVVSPHSIDRNGLLRGETKSNVVHFNPNTERHPDDGFDDEDDQEGGDDGNDDGDDAGDDEMKAPPKDPYYLGGPPMMGGPPMIEGQGNMSENEFAPPGMGGMGFVPENQFGDPVDGHLSREDDENDGDDENEGDDGDDGDDENDGDDANEGDDGDDKNDGDDGDDANEGDDAASVSARLEEHQRNQMQGMGMTDDKAALVAEFETRMEQMEQEHRLEMEFLKKKLNQEQKRETINAEADDALFNSLGKYEREVIEKRIQGDDEEERNLMEMRPIIEQDPAPYFNFTSGSLSLPFPIDASSSNQFAFALWVFLFPSSFERQSRYILTTKAYDCKEDEIDENSGGIALYINEHDTENFALILEYTTEDGCDIIEELGVVIPMGLWNHIGVAYNVDSLTLFLNGKILASVGGEDDDEVLSPLKPSKQSKTVVGEVLEGGNVFDGAMTMLSIWKDTEVTEEMMRNTFLHGHDAGKIKENSPTYLYAFAESEPLKELMDSKDATSNAEKSPEIHDVEEAVNVAEIDPNWTPLGPDRFSEYKDGDNVFKPTKQVLKKSDEVARSRRTAVRNAMRHAWNGYKKYAWGRDEVKPQSLKGQDNWGGMATTMVDALDTLWLMGMKEEFWEARDWIRDHLNNDIPRKVSVFETTIRSLGGLLSAYDWSGDKAFLDKATDLGERLFHAFDTPDGIPDGEVNLHNHQISTASWLKGKKSLAEVGTLQVEFRYLAKVTGKTEFATKSEKVFEKLKKIQPKKNGLFPFFLARGNRNGLPVFGNKEIKLGANGDSFYEYMLKIWLQGGKKEDMYREMYDKAMDGVHDELLFKTSKKGLTYIAELYGDKVNRRMDHLVCYLAGSLALGAYTHPEGLDSPKAQRDFKTGKALAYTCYQMYAQTKTGIGPEITIFKGNKEMTNDPGAAYYLLRPEAIESFFILHQLTGDPTYREWGWEVFQAIERFCKTKFAYGGIANVDKPDEKPTDKMESFFLGETLKYLYLLQDPDTEIDILNKHVFNTEAHPLRIFPVMDEEAVA